MTELAWRFRDVDTAHILQTAFDPSPAIHPGITVIAPIDQLLGQLSALLGDPRASKTHMEVAMAACHDGGCRPLLARAQLAYPRTGVTPGR